MLLVCFLEFWEFGPILIPCRDPHSWSPRRDAVLRPDIPFRGTYMRAYVDILNVVD